jgi:hypothetical protein
MKRLGVAAAFALCAAFAVGCGGQGSGRLAQVQAGPMPQGATFRGVWYNPSWGELHLVATGDEVVGRWRSAQRGLWGQMTGTVNGDVIRFRWEERKVGGIDPGSVRKGRGFFKYVPVEPPDLPRLRGEWGLGDSETGGGEWDCVKQKDVEPRLESIGNDPDPTLENWDRPKQPEGGS